METMTPPDPNFADRVRASFEKQQVMSLLGAALVRVDPGVVEIAMPFAQQLTQQHGFLHAGIVATIADSACGYAALSLMPPGTGVMAVEFKANFLAPAKGSRFLARGRVVRAGRTVMVCAGDVVAVQDNEDGTGEREVAVATMLGTMMVIRDRAGVTD